jgi:hypothetical protein
MRVFSCTAVKVSDYYPDLERVPSTNGTCAEYVPITKELLFDVRH